MAPVSYHGVDTLRERFVQDREGNLRLQRCCLAHGTGPYPSPILIRPTFDLPQALTASVGREDVAVATGSILFF